jgi:hypothetical protein
MKCHWWSIYESDDSPLSFRLREKKEGNKVTSTKDLIIIPFPMRDLLVATEAFCA